MTRQHALVLVLAVAVLAAAGAQPLALPVGGPGHGPGHGPSVAATEALPAPGACVTVPTAAECSSFVYPAANIANDLERLCASMPYMATCSVVTACNISGAGFNAAPGSDASNVSRNDPGICDPLVQLATICMRDTGMARMAPCGNVLGMCARESLVPQCKGLRTLTSIPSSKALNTQVRSICSEVKMESCDECAGKASATEAGAKGKNKTKAAFDPPGWANCDLLTVYSRMCSSAPELKQCAEFHQSCRADASLWFCRGYSDTAQKAAAEVLAADMVADREAPIKAPAAAAKSSVAGAGAPGVLLLLGVLAALAL